VFPVFVSQPLAALLSQLPQPVSQAVTRQAPVVHDSVAWSSAQAAPQAPQSPSVRRLVSQPSDGAPLQLPQPLLQASTVHCEEAQPGVPFGAEHETPQPPQLAGSVVVKVSHPLTALSSQSAVPGVAQKEQPHVPVVHLGVQPEEGHTVEQPPQWLTSILVLTSQPLAGLPSQSM
jgi:hypothetical protein